MYRIFNKFILSMVFVSTTGCTNMLGATPERSSNGNITPSIEGWMQVSFPNNESYYDELIGSLVDEGLDVKKSIWLKPSYGNENLLWTYGTALGNQQRIKLSQSKEDFNKKYYEFYEGKIDIGKISWGYSGYLNKRRKAVPPYQYFSFVCEGDTSGVTVFYWGNELSIVSLELEYIKDLLSKLSDKCH